MSRPGIEEAQRNAAGHEQCNTAPQNSPTIVRSLLRLPLKRCNLDCWLGRIEHIRANRLGESHVPSRGMTWD